MGLIDTILECLYGKGPVERYGKQAYSDEAAEYYNAYIKRYCAQKKEDLEADLTYLRKGYLNFFDKPQDVYDDYDVPLCPDGAINLSDVEYEIGKWVQNKRSGFNAENVNEVKKLIDDLNYTYHIHYLLSRSNQSDLDRLSSKRDNIICEQNKKDSEEKENDY